MKIKPELVKPYHRMERLLEQGDKGKVIVTIDSHKVVGLDVDRRPDGTAGGQTEQGRSKQE